MGLLNKVRQRHHDGVAVALVLLADTGFALLVEVEVAALSSCFLLPALTLDHLEVDEPLDDVLVVVCLPATYCVRHYSPSFSCSHCACIIAECVVKSCTMRLLLMRSANASFLVKPAFIQELNSSWSPMA